MNRKGYGIGRGQGYKNLIKGYDRRIHQLSGKGIKQPQKLSTIKRKASLRLVKALRRYMKKCEECGVYFDKKRHGDCPRCIFLEFKKEVLVPKEKQKWVITDNGKVIHTSRDEVSAFRWLQAHKPFKKKHIDELRRFKILKGGKTKDRNSFEEWWQRLSPHEKFLYYITGEKEKEKKNFAEWDKNFGEFREAASDYFGKKQKGGKCTPSQLKHGSDPDKLFSKAQLKAGIKVEKEHTNDKSLAKAIAKAHLTEDKAYYKKLARLGL